MFTRLRQPGGVLGVLSLTAALFLGVLGVLGVVSLLIAAVAGSEFWSDQRDEQLISAVLFAVVGAGAVGFLIMDRRPWLGAAMAVIGSLLMALILFWAILPLVLGPVFAVVAVLRARVFARRASASRQATT
jgi:ABC-type Mn2+/Zn2+ transport system permease subunit